MMAPTMSLGTRILWWREGREGGERGRGGRGERGEREGYAERKFAMAIFRVPSTRSVNALH